MSWAFLRERNFLHLVGGEHFGLVGKMRRVRAIALSIGENGIGAGWIGKFDCEDPAVAMGDTALSNIVVPESEDAECAHSPWRKQGTSPQATFQRLKCWPWRRWVLSQMRLIRIGREEFYPDKSWPVEAGVSNDFRAFEGI